MSDLLPAIQALTQFTRLITNIGLSAAEVVALQESLGRELTVEDLKPLADKADESRQALDDALNPDPTDA